MTGKALLAVDNLAISFQTAQAIVPAIRSVSFTVAPGEVVGIVGESGSGKTVACRAILRLLARNARIASGKIEFEGQDILALSDSELMRLRGGRIAMIFQNPSTHLDPLMTIGRQVGEALQVHQGASAAEARRQSIGLLADMRIPEPERRIDAYAHEMSGGMRQRVMIAAALACRPSLLLADEPTTALDVTVQAQILDLLKRIQRERNLAIVLVSHDLGVIAQMCDRVVVMKDGLVVETGPVDDVIMRPQEEYTRRLIASQPSLMPKATPVTRSQPPLLRLDRLSVHFGQSRGIGSILTGGKAHTVRAVDDVSIAISPGETLGIVGESGSGKSTIARAIVGLADVHSGNIIYDGEDVGNLRGAARLRFRRAVQMVFQDPFTSLNPAYTVAQTLAEPLRQHRLCPTAAIPERVSDLMRKVELPESLRDRRSVELSGGQRQRVGIARALALEPKLIIADEVTSALDVTIQAQILTLFKKLRDSMNLSIILISHDLAVVRHLCERIAVMRHGKLVEYGTTAEIFEAPREAYTRELLAAILRIKSPEIRQPAADRLLDQLQ